MCMEVYQPIFIIGVERSGTTLLYSILSNHPDLYWFSRLDSILPSSPRVSSLLRRAVSLTPTDTVYIAVPGTISRSKGLLPPSECLPYWRNIFKWGTEENYGIKNDYFDENDVTSDIEQFLHEDFQRRLSWMQKEGLLFKQPGFSLKIRFLNAVFPDALFLHIVRNPFANFESLVRAKEASGEKFWGIKVPGWRNLLSANKELQAAIQIQTTLRIIEEDIHSVGAKKRYLQIRFEHLLNNPYSTLKMILQFCNLSWVDNIDYALEGIHSNSGSKSIQRQLSRRVKEILIAVAEGYGYV